MKLRDLILHNFQLKLFSLVLAVLVWESIHLFIRRDAGGSFLPFVTQTNAPPPSP
ncbi:MAG: hypothetical protein HZA90_25355 [Verrucomicrobia bacterium]|nr:hypothetical protein [Verrucomicrobiota bacterium]